MGKFGNTKQFCMCPNIGMAKIIDAEKEQKIEQLNYEYIKEYELGLQHFKKAKELLLKIENLIGDKNE